MDTPTKQRLVGAAVLVALAVIFLPMLVKGPAPDSGVSDVPLTMPDAPADGMESRDLPLVTPQGGAKGALSEVPPVAGERLPTVDADAAQASAAGDGIQPAGVAAGDYAVHFGTYATSADADTIVAQLRSARLPGHREQTTLNGKTAWRVRVGPYATRAEAEAARVRATGVRSDVGARVVVLDADAAAPAPATATASQPAAKLPAPVVTTEALPPAAPAPKPATPPVAATSKPVEPTKPVTPPPAATAPAPTKLAASGVGYAVQVGAFGNAAEAGKLRDRLRAAGFVAFTETVNSDKGSLTRVRVGPVVTRAEADTLKSQVSAKAGVSGIVRTYP